MSRFTEQKSLLECQVHFVRTVVGTLPTRQAYVCEVCGEDFKRYTPPKSRGKKAVLCDECYAELAKYPGAKA